ncbi:MBL fold metallo-hydrolase [Chitinophaga sp. YIM B06452]|uniref:MBL fold metallo-hydrolase n=1 Tax=Chitinophaga sp. YIM B06452 TaxID=3082158 RepID=UPI0031FF023E
MRSILEYELFPSQAAMWWLGQAGYIIRSCGITVAIDPYLSDAAAAGAPEFSRLYPAPIQPEDLAVDIYITTHDHLDHLDPGTLSEYQHKQDTWFAAPSLTARKLIETGVPEHRVVVINVGESKTIKGLEVSGIFALPTGPDVLDTTGYHIKFPNGRNVYHTSDTQFHPLLMAAAPQRPEVMMVPVNGKWGNPGPEQAAELSYSLQPTFVMPNHYDMMALNAENPEVFKWFCTKMNMQEQCIIPERMQPFVWF